MQLAGLASLGLGIWQLVVESQIDEVLSEVNSTVGAALFIVSGTLLTALAIIGIFGAWFKWRVALIIVKLLAIVCVSLLSS